MTHQVVRIRSDRETSLRTFRSQQTADEYKSKLAQRFWRNTYMVRPLS